MHVAFVDSVQGHQTGRLREMADRLRKARPDVSVGVVEGDAAGDLLKRHRLNFGPAVLIDQRLEFVGVPRWRFLLERVSQLSAGLQNPRSASPPAAPTTEKPAPGPPAKPGGADAAGPAREPPPA
ncbi:MAG TPA: hypothetical protein VJ400_00575 [Thermoplasmata archaeon]|nr:hypothetical protein [Thermoplasmata archaeon]